MGANGSYKYHYGGVPSESRSHTDTHHHIDGHKILLQTCQPGQSKNIMWSNSDSPIYLIAKKNRQGKVVIESVNIFDGHKLAYEINLKFDRQGNLKEYNPNKPELVSHAHQWIDGEKPGYRQRKTDANGNSLHLSIPSKYTSLINKIVQYNKKVNNS